MRSILNTNFLLTLRFRKALSRLPENWISLFVFKHPEYKSEVDYLYYMCRGDFMDRDIIKKMEALAEFIKGDHPEKLCL